MATVIIMLILIFKASLVVFSALATFLSLVFMLSPSFYAKIEDVLGMEFGGGTSFSTVLEGKIDLLNDWVSKNRLFFGPLLALLAALNTRNAFFL